MGEASVGLDFRIHGISGRSRQVLGIRQSVASSIQILLVVLYLVRRVVVGRPATNQYHVLVGHGELIIRNLQASRLFHRPAVEGITIYVPWLTLQRDFRANRNVCINICIRHFFIRKRILVGNIKCVLYIVECKYIQRIVVSYFQTRRRNAVKLIIFNCGAANRTLQNRLTIFCRQCYRFCNCIFGIFIQVPDRIGLCIRLIDNVYVNRSFITRHQNTASCLASRHCHPVECFGSVIGNSGNIYFYCCAIVIGPHIIRISEHSPISVHIMDNNLVLRRINRIRAIQMPSISAPYIVICTG